MLFALRMALTARLVADGFLRTNSLFPASEQQKYCDHGRSVTVFTMTWPIFFARSSWGSGEEAHEGIDFPVGKQPHRFGEGMHDPFDILGRIEADVGCHAGEQCVSARVETGHGDCLVLQIVYRAHRADAKQLVAADMNARQQNCWRTRVHVQYESESNPH